MPPTRLLALSLVVLAACGDDAAQPDDLSTALESIRAAHDVPALSAALATTSGVVEIGAAGTRHAGTSVAVTTSDQWHLGSCTKAMTATLVAMAVEEGRLGWDTTLAEALPGLTGMHASYRDVPVEWLLVHRAGTWSTFEGHEAELETLSDADPVEVQRAQFAALVLRAAPERTPGSAYAYSNAGYMIAGAILERLYGVSWETLITERLFAPLGMSSCGFGAPGSAAALDQPWGHAGPTMVPVPPGPAADNPPAVGPAGTVHCALADWAKFGALQLGAHPELIAPASLTRMHTPPFAADAYAHGWVLGNDPLVGDFLLHDGSNTLWLAVIMLLPADQQMLLVAANAATDETTAAVNEALITLAGRRH